MSLVSGTLPTVAGAYSSDVEGGAMVVQRFDVEGRMDDQYLDFVAERAGWLSLSGWARRADNGRIEIVAAGPEALVGALEMACTLGPLNTLVDTVSVQAVPDSVPGGFEVRR